MLRIEDKTLREIKRTKVLLLLIGSMMGIVSIWVTYNLENMNEFTIIGGILNILSGIGFICIGFKAFQTDVSINKKQKLSMEKYQQLIEDVKELKKKMKKTSIEEQFLNDEFEKFCDKSKKKPLPNFQKQFILLLLLLLPTTILWWRLSYLEIIFPTCFIFFIILEEFVIQYMKDSCDEIATIYKVLPECIPKVIVKKEV